MAAILTIPQAQKQAIQNFRPDMSNQEKNNMLREAIFSAMESSVGLPLEKKPMSIGQPINPPVNHFRRAIKHPSLLTPADTTNVSDLANPLVEERSPPSTPVRQVAQTPVEAPGAPKKPTSALDSSSSFKKKTVPEPATPSTPTRVPRPQEVGPSTPVKKTPQIVRQAGETVPMEEDPKPTKVTKKAAQEEDKEEEMHADNEKEETPKKTPKKKRTFEIDPAELSGVGNSFPVNNVSSKFFKGLFDNGELKEDDAHAAEEDDGEMMESAMISEVGSAIVSPDSSDDEIDFDDKGAVHDEEEDELKLVNKETNQVKRKKEEPKKARKSAKPAVAEAPKQEETFKMPSEQDTATALLLETERCMVPALAQINMILADADKPVFNIQHKRLVSVWMSFFASDWHCLDNNNRNMFHQLLNELVSRWVPKSNTTPSYGRINNLVSELRTAPCCVMDIASNLTLSPSVQCYISDTKVTESNNKDFIRVHLSMQTKNGEVCKNIAFYCLNKYKKLIMALYFALHNASWVSMVSSTDADVQENMETNKANFHKNCIETLQTLLAYKAQL